MDTLLLTASNPEVELTSSDRLFYDRYQYSLRFCLQEFHCIRPWHDYRGADVQELLQLIDQYQHKHYLRYRPGYLYNMVYGNLGKFADDSAYQQQVSQDLYPIVKLLWPHRANIRIVATHDWGYVYSNCLSILKLLADTQPKQTTRIQQAVIDRAPNTVGLRKKQHNYRTYFRDLRVTEDQRNQIQQYLAQQQDIRLCPSLKSWSPVDRTYPWVTNVAWSRSTFFFDHQGAADALMLEMLVPGIVRKTLEIVQINNSTNYTPGN